MHYELFARTVYMKGDAKRKKGKGLRELDPQPAFDLVIADEAHHLRTPGTNSHELAERPSYCSDRNWRTAGSLPSQTLRPRTWGPFRLAGTRLSCCLTPVPVGSALCVEDLARSGENGLPQIWRDSFPE